MPPDRIATALRDLAATLPEGARLPSVRELMREHGASPVTVQRAIAALAAEGLVVPRPGRGTFVAAPPARNGASDLALAGGGARRARAATAAGSTELLALPPEGTLALSSGYLDPRLQPTAALAAALARAGRRPGAWERGAVEGVAALRAWFAREAGGRFAAHDVVICPGGQAALVTAVRALAAARRRRCVVESPTYRGALAAVRAAGLTPVPVPSDADGVRPALLADALERTGARVAYLQPLHANPHGADLSAERRAEVMEIAARAGAFLIEDDWARDLTIDGPARRRRSPPTTPTATSSTSARSARAPRRGCGSRPSPRAGRPARGCARRASSRTCSSAPRSSTRRSSSSPHRAGAVT